MVRQIREITRIVVPQNGWQMLGARSLPVGSRTAVRHRETVIANYGACVCFEKDWFDMRFGCEWPNLCVLIDCFINLGKLIIHAVVGQASSCRVASSGAGDSQSKGERVEVRG